MLDLERNRASCNGHGRAGRERTQGDGFDPSAGASVSRGSAQPMLVAAFGKEKAASARSDGHRYLISGKLPPAGTVCPQTVQPFPAP